MKKIKRLLSISLLLILGGCSINNTTKVSLNWNYIGKSPRASDSSLQKTSKQNLKDMMKRNEYGQISLEGVNLSKYDLSKKINQLEIANWDSKTVWPSSSLLPKSFHPNKIMKIGKNPGLGIRKLHSQGITGKNVGIGIIDSSLLTDHIEYKNQLHFYGEFNNIKNYDYADDHASAVASIAVGKNIGVAPDANLFFIKEGMFRTGVTHSQLNKAISQDIQRFITLNNTLPKNKKIRIISISTGVYMQEENYTTVEKAIKKADENGITVLTGNKYTQDFAMGLSRLFYGDPDKIESYIPASYMDAANNGLPRYHESKLIVPMERKTLASSTGTQNYRYESMGGVSWSIPYVAGVYALACQQKPDITYEEFISIANETATPLQTTYKNQTYNFEKVISPQNIIAFLQNNS